MTVKSLAELAIMAAYSALQQILDCGDVLTLDQLRPLLHKITDANQLRMIEERSPQLQGLLGEFWIKLIKQDFPIEYKARVYVPKDPEKWHEIYIQYKIESHEELHDRQVKLQNKFGDLQKAKEEKYTKIVPFKNIPESLRKTDCKKRSIPRAEVPMKRVASGMKKVRREAQQMSQATRTIPNKRIAPSPKIHDGKTSSLALPQRFSNAREEPNAQELNAKLHSLAAEVEAEEASGFGGKPAQAAAHVVNEKSRAAARVVNKPAVAPRPSRPLTAFERKFSKGGFPWNPDFFKPKIRIERVPVDPAPPPSSAEHSPTLPRVCEPSGSSGVVKPRRPSIFMPKRRTN